MRRPVISAPRLMVEWLETAAAARDTRFDIELMYPEGAWVGAGEPLAYITGSLVHLSDLETILLQKIGPASVAAHNAYQMCLALPDVAFLAMEARHCAGAEMQDMMAYAASVGSDGGEAGRRQGFHRQRQRRHRALVRRAARLRHDAAFADRLCRLDAARRGDVPRDLPRRTDDGAGGLLRPRDHRRARGLRAVPRSRRAMGGCRSGWTRMAGASWKGSIRRRATRCWNATRRARSVATAARPSCAIWSAPASPPPRSGGCARRSTRPAIRACASSPRPDSASTSAA